MSGWSRGAPHPIKDGGVGGGPPFPDPSSFSRHHRPMQPRHLIDDMREVSKSPLARGGASGPRGLPVRPAVLGEWLAAQHQEIQGLLVDNQRLAATHVAFKQEFAAAQHEIHILSHNLTSMRSDKDLEFREIYEKSMKMEAELGAVEAMRAELILVRWEIQKLNASDGAGPGNRAGFD